MEDQYCRNLAYVSFYQKILLQFNVFFFSWHLLTLEPPPNHIHLSYMNVHFIFWNHTSQVCILFKIYTV